MTPDIWPQRQIQVPGSAYLITSAKLVTEQHPLADNDATAAHSSLATKRYKGVHGAPFSQVRDIPGPTVARRNGRARRGLAAGALASIARARHVAQKPPVARCGEGVDGLLLGVGCAAGIGAAVAVAGASADGPNFLTSRRSAPGPPPAAPSQAAVSPARETSTHPVSGPRGSFAPLPITANATVPGSRLVCPPLPLPAPSPDPALALCHRRTSKCRSSPDTRQPRPGCRRRSASRP